MDKFFSQRNCDRCGKPLTDGRIMSMYNTDCICLECKRKETERADYKAAAEADKKAIENGDFNYKGIGLETPKSRLQHRRSKDYGITERAKGTSTTTEAATMHSTCTAYGKARASSLDALTGRRTQARLKPTYNCASQSAIKP